MGIEAGVDNVGANFALDSTGRKKIFEDKTKTVTLEVHQMTKVSDMSYRCVPFSFASNCK